MEAARAKFEILPKHFLEWNLFLSTDQMKQDTGESRDILNHFRAVLYQGIYSARQLFFGVFF